MTRFVIHIGEERTEVEVVDHTGYYQPPLPFDQTVSPEGIDGEETFDSNP